MGTTVPIQRLARHDYASWKYGMHKYLLKQDYWTYKEKAPHLINPNYPMWQRGANRVMTHICLGSLTHKYGVFRTAIATRENPPSFFKLQFVLMVEENRTQSKRKARHQMGR